MPVVFLILAACTATVPRPLDRAPTPVPLAGCPAPPLPAAPAHAPTLREDLLATPTFSDLPPLYGAPVHAQWAKPGDTWLELPGGDLAGWAERFGTLGSGDPRDGVLVCVGTSKVGVATRIELAVGDNPRVASEYQGEPGLPLLAVPGLVLDPGDTVTAELFAGEARLGSASMVVADLSQALTLRSPEMTVACRVGTANPRYVTEAAQTLASIGCEASLDVTRQGLGRPFQLDSVHAFAEVAAGDLGWADPRLQALVAAADAQERSFAAAAAARVAELVPSVSETLDAGLVHGTVRYTCAPEPFPGAKPPAGACTIVGDFVADGDLTVDRGGITLLGAPDQILYTLGLVWPDGRQEFAPPSFLAVDGAPPVQVDDLLTNDVHGPVVVAIPEGATVRMLFAPVLRVPAETPSFVQVLGRGGVVARVRPGR